MVFAEDELYCDISSSIVYSTDLCWAMQVGKHFLGFFFHPLLALF